MTYPYENLIAVDPIPFPVSMASMEKLAHHTKAMSMPNYDWRKYNDQWDEHQAYERGKEAL